MKFGKKVLDVVRKVQKTFNEKAGTKKFDENKTENDNDKLEKSTSGLNNLELQEQEENLGEIKFSDEVVAITAALAAQEVPGVLSMSGGLADDVAKIMGKEKAARGVRVGFDGKMVNVNIYLVVEYGSNIPELALAVQEHVKRAIEDMAGYEVQFVDVHIENVVHRDEIQLKLLEGDEE